MSIVISFLLCIYHSFPMANLLIIFLYDLRYTYCFFIYHQWFVWDKVSKSGPNKTCGRQPLKSWRRLVCFKHIPSNFVKDLLPQILLGPFLNTLSVIETFCGQTQHFITLACNRDLTSKQWHFLMFYYFLLRSIDFPLLRRCHFFYAHKFLFPFLGLWFKFYIDSLFS